LAFNAAKASANVAYPPSAPVEPDTVTLVSPSGWKKASCAALNIEPAATVQKKRKIKKHGVRKADLETSFLFIRGDFLWWKRVFVGGPNLRNPTLSTANRPSYIGIRLVTEEEN
jgi:hypothetical protein